MAEQISGTNENQGTQAEVDPWIAAFAALEPKSEEASQEDAGSEQHTVGGEDAGSEQSGIDSSGENEGGDSNTDENTSGGLDSSSGTDDSEGGSIEGSAFSDVDVTPESIEEYEKNLNEQIRDKAIDDVAQEFIKRGIRNRNGKLGATLDDDDICKRDEDGVPHFYNPETGREFTGDNPRRQAQEWVDDYNNELARVFNETCEKYENQLKQQSAPQLAVMKFAPKYNKLDEIRRGMFDNVIEDYEITDSDGKIVGYSCDLDKALALVERQVTMIQNYAKQQRPKEQPSGPALDMKTSSGAVQTDDAPINSLEDAMLRIQNKQLEQLKKN